MTFNSRPIPAGRLVLLLVAIISAIAPAAAQDNYEIQVYGVDTVNPRSTMFEIHSNFTVEGSKTVQGGVLPSNHAEHETLRSHRESTTGLKLVSTFSPAFSPTADGNGWAITFAHVCGCPNRGTGPWV